MRAAGLAAGLLLAASCGGSPTTPSPVAAPTPTLPAVVLDPGPYALTIALATAGTPTCQNGICVSTSLCTGDASPASAILDVTVERSAETATVRASSGGSPLTLNLTVTSAAVTGTISGSARDAHGVLIQAAGTIFGAATDPRYAVSGHVDGQVWVASGSCSNNGHTWSLAPR